MWTKKQASCLQVNKEINASCLHVNKEINASWLHVNKEISALIACEQGNKCFDLIRTKKQASPLHVNKEINALIACERGNKCFECTWTNNKCCDCKKKVFWQKWTRKQTLDCMWTKKQQRLDFPWTKKQAFWLHTNELCFYQSIRPHLQLSSIFVLLHTTHQLWDNAYVIGILINLYGHWGINAHD